MSSNVYCQLNQNAASVYVNIYNDDKQVWDVGAEAFVAYEAANIADYDIAATQVSESDWYVVDLSTVTNLTLGLNLTIVFYWQTGTAVEGTDPIKKEVEIFWNGNAVSPSGGLDTYVLTSVARYKAYAGITVSTYDDLIILLINAATKIIEEALGMLVMARTYTEEPALVQEWQLSVQNKPIQSITSIKVGDDIFTTNNTDYTFDSDLGEVKLSTSMSFTDSTIRFSTTNGYFVYITYVGGFVQSPRDLEFLCWEIIRRAFEGRETNSGMNSENIGNYSYSRAVGQLYLNLDELNYLASWKAKHGMLLPI
jgi:hypothetical protein